MEVHFCNQIPPRDVLWALFQSTGWNEVYRLSPEELWEAISASWHVVAVYDGAGLVGFGRLVSDGVLHAMIYELIVAPEYQKRGIGSQVLERLVDACKAHRIRDIQLFCARGKRAFYEKRGFAARPEQAPGMQYQP